MWKKWLTAPHRAHFVAGLRMSLCCKKTEFYSRHLAVVEFFTKYIRVAGVRVDNEVQIGGRQRPADLLLTRWTGERFFVGDVVVTLPLPPSLGLSSATAAAAVRSKTARKTAKHAQLVATHDLEFAPLAFSTFGEQCEECSEFRGCELLLRQARYLKNRWRDAV